MSADERPAPHEGGGAPPPARWKGLARRHPASVTAQRIREHIARYEITGPSKGLLAGAADQLDHLARKEPNK